MINSSADAMIAVFFCISNCAGVCQIPSSVSVLMFSCSCWSLWWGVSADKGLILSLVAIWSFSAFSIMAQDDEFPIWFPQRTRFVSRGGALFGFDSGAGVGFTSSVSGLAFGVGFALALLFCFFPFLAAAVSEMTTAFGHSAGMSWIIRESEGPCRVKVATLDSPDHTKQQPAYSTTCPGSPTGP